MASFLCYVYCFSLALLYFTYQSLMYWKINAHSPTSFSICDSNSSTNALNSSSLRVCSFFEVVNSGTVLKTSRYGLVLVVLKGRSRITWATSLSSSHQYPLGQRSIICAGLLDYPILPFHESISPRAGGVNQAMLHSIAL